MKALIALLMTEQRPLHRDAADGGSCWMITYFLLSLMSERVSPFGTLPNLLILLHTFYSGNAMRLLP
jgi:hypothetical protein